MSRKRGRLCIGIEVPSDRARAVVDALERDMTANLATRSDLDSKFALLDRKIEGAEKRLDQKIESLEARLDQRMDSLEARLDRDFKAVEGQFESHGHRFDEKLKLLETSMMVKLGGLLFLAMGLLFAALQLV